MRKDLPAANPECRTASPCGIAFFFDIFRLRKMTRPLMPELQPVLQVSGQEDVQRIFLLFDEFNMYKEVLYRSIQQHLGGGQIADLYFHHFQPQVFEQLLRSANGRYSRYVVMPVLYDGLERALSRLPARKVLILDQGWASVGQQYPSVCQDFESDMYEALRSVSGRLARYRRLVLVYDHPQPAPVETINQDLKAGFMRFVCEHKIAWALTGDLQRSGIGAGDACVVFNDTDLVTLVKDCRRLGLEPGRDVGILSRNDTPLKEIIGNGITAMSTDFGAMGRSVAELLHSGLREHRKNPSSVILRHSL